MCVCVRERERVRESRCCEECVCVCVCVCARESVCEIPAVLSDSCGKAKHSHMTQKGFGYRVREGLWDVGLGNMS